MAAFSTVNTSFSSFLQFMLQIVEQTQAGALTFERIIE
jgi:hypothetical protein